MYQTDIFGLPKNQTGTLTNLFEFKFLLTAQSERFWLKLFNNQSKKLKIQPVFIKLPLVFSSFGFDFIEEKKSEQGTAKIPI